MSQSPTTLEPLVSDRKFEASASTYWWFIRILMRLSDSGIMSFDDFDKITDQKIDRSIKDRLINRIAQALFDSLAGNFVSLYEIDVLRPGHPIAKIAGREKFQGPFRITYATLEAILTKYRHYSWSRCQGIIKRMIEASTVQEVNKLAAPAVELGMLKVNPENQKIKHNPNVFGSSSILEAIQARVRYY